MPSPNYHCGTADKRLCTRSATDTGTRIETYFRLLSLPLVDAVMRKTPGSFRKTLRIVSADTPQALASSAGSKCL